MQFFLVRWNCLLPDPDVLPNVLRDCVQLHESEKGGQVENDGQVKQDVQVKQDGNFWSYSAKCPISDVCKKIDF